MLISALLVALLLLVFFWPRLMRFWNAKVSRAVDEYMPENFAKVLKAFMIRLDSAACPTRKGMMKVWNNLKGKITRFATKYELLGEGLVRIQRVFSAFGEKITLRKTEKFRDLPPELQAFLGQRAATGDSVAYTEETITVEKKIESLKETGPMAN